MVRLLQVLLLLLVVLLVLEQLVVGIGHCVGPKAVGRANCASSASATATAPSHSNTHSAADIAVVAMRTTTTPSVGAHDGVVVGAAAVAGGLAGE